METNTLLTLGFRGFSEGTKSMLVSCAESFRVYLYSPNDLVFQVHSQSFGSILISHHNNTIILIDFEIFNGSHDLLRDNWGRNQVIEMLLILDLSIHYN